MGQVVCWLCCCPRSLAERWCIFCKYADGSESPSGGLLHEDDSVVAFQDRSPAAAHHLLVIPRAHIANWRHLTPEELPLLERMIHVAEMLLKARGCDSNYRLVFHSPFNSVCHLHLHAVTEITIPWWHPKHHFWKYCVLDAYELLASLRLRRGECENSGQFRRMEP
eukprot:TRINITY_DN78854_c0_g1_i1.p1 TRINITY_DN78854_c0_g1~~TRINITY_DN78854_c0_g1_i1.p1  ORF type:complete len:191 (-),score=21.11 TRINITY_DN78854_c0_g1_i1:39-536(-)